jgi:hypothetical protein
MGSFKAGDECWLLVQGPPNVLEECEQGQKPANVHKAVIVAAVDAKGFITVNRPGWEDESMGDADNIVVYEDVTNLKVKIPQGDEDDYETNKTISDLHEGNGKVTLALMDSRFDADVDDMVKMKELNDAELCKNLEMRFFRQECYCRCGITLVAINLYEPREAYGPTGALHHVFAKETLRNYIDVVDRDKADPHIFNLSSHCYHNLFKPIRPPATTAQQAIVITGESGAGKTFNTKKVLDFIAECGAMATREQGGNVGGVSITDLMLETTPILEGFGNANMPRNPDSSRFGKLYKVYFSKRTREVTACEIEPYMLEKSRTTSQQMNERCFHIFYRMMGPTPELLRPDKRQQYEQGIKGYVYDKSRFGLKEFTDLLTPEEIRGTEAAMQKKAEELAKMNEIEDEAKPFKKIIQDAGPGPEREEAIAKVKEIHQRAKPHRIAAEAAEASIKVHQTSDYLYLNGGSMFVDENYKKIYNKTLPVGWKAPLDPASKLPSCCPKNERDFEDGTSMCDTIKALEMFFNPDGPDGTPGTNHAAVDHIFAIAAGVLHLGNIKIVGDDNENDQSSRISTDADTNEAIDWVCRLWQVDRTMLMQAINQTTISRQSRGETIKTPSAFGKKNSETRRDTMARHVYDTLFEWLVRTCSQTLMSKGAQGRSADAIRSQDIFMGVLDIFGFEFVVDEQLESVEGRVLNTLDQLCINMCNETLQQNFIHVVFDLEQVLYKDQLGAPIDMPLGNIENEDTVNMLYKNAKSSIARVLNDANKQKKDDKKFYQELMQKSSRDNNFKKRMFVPNSRGRGKYPKGPYGGDGFIVDHYAARVTYDVRGWTEKNLDRLTDDTYELLGASNDKIFMGPEFTFKFTDDNAKFLIQDFGGKLTSLIEQLNSCQVNFVRCIKASSPLAARKYNRALVLNQLKYTGMLDTLKIRRKGFPFRMDHQRFWDDYHVLAPNVISPHLGAGYNPQEMQAEIQKMVPEVLRRLSHEMPPEELRHLQAQADDAIRMGNSASGGESLVFCRDWLGNGLNDLRLEALERACIVAQCAYRGSDAAKKYRKIVAARDIQTISRTWNLHYPYAAMRCMALIVQKEFRNVLPVAQSALPEDNKLMAGAYNDTLDYLEKVKEFEEAEREERREKAAEEEYAWQLKFARFEETIEQQKHDEFVVGEHAYKAAQDVLADLDAKLNAPAPPPKQNAEPAFLPKAGVVRSVPLVRRFRQSGSSKWTPPPRTAYKFSYEFECKRPDSS